MITHFSPSAFQRLCRADTALQLQNLLGFFCPIPAPALNSSASATNCLHVPKTQSFRLSVFPYYRIRVTQACNREQGSGTQVTSLQSPCSHPVVASGRTDITVVFIRSYEDPRKLGKKHL